MRNYASQSYGKYNILRGLIWGTKGERLFLKLQGKRPTEDSARTMRKVERGGFCQSYGIIPVHTIVNGAIPAAFSLAASEVGLPHISPIVWFPPIILAVASSYLPIKANAVRKSSSPRSYVRKRQLKVYAASLLAGLAVNAAVTVSRNDNHKTDASPDMKTGMVIKQEKSAMALPPLPDGRKILIALPNHAQPA